MNKVRSRPAETGGVVAGGVGAAIAILVGVKDPNKVAAINILVGCAPAIVTYVVGIIRGDAV